MSSVVQCHMMGRVTCTCHFEIRGILLEGILGILMEVERRLDDDDAETRVLNLSLRVRHYSSNLREMAFSPRIPRILTSTWLPIL
mgnify:FL=1